MNKRIALVVASVGAILLGSGVPAVAAGSAAYTCTGGPIGSGTYASITVTGYCGVVPGADITVVGNLTVAPGALLDAQSAPSSITVGHNVVAGTGSFLGLGCQPDYVDAQGNHLKTGHPCLTPYADASSAISVAGNVTATGADTVLLNGIAVGGNVSLSGGGGDIPWSIKNNEIAGNLTVGSITADWLGVLFNEIGGNAVVTNVTATDPGDPGRKIFVVRNDVGRNLICFGLEPGVSGGFVPGSVNVVGGKGIGQCAALV